MNPPQPPMMRPPGPLGVQQRPMGPPGAGLPGQMAGMNLGPPSKPAGMPRPMGPPSGMPGGPPGGHPQPVGPPGMAPSRPMAPPHMNGTGGMPPSSFAPTMNGPSSHQNGQSNGQGGFPPPSLSPQPPRPTGMPGQPPAMNSLPPGGSRMPGMPPSTQAASSGFTQPNNSFPPGPPGSMPPAPGMPPSSMQPSSMPPSSMPPSSMPPSSMPPSSMPPSSMPPSSSSNMPSFGMHPGPSSNMPSGPGSMPQAPGGMPSRPGMMPPGPGQMMPPRQGMPGQMPPGPGQMPPGPGQMPPGPGQINQGSGQMPPGPGGMPPRPGMPGQMPPGPGQMPPGPSQMPPGPGQMPPGPGQMPPGPGQMPPGPGGMPPRPGMPGQMPGGMPGQMPGGMPGQMPQGPNMSYPGAPQPGGFGAQPQGRRTLDPDQMPSPITVWDEDQKNNGGYFETKEKGLTPPLVTTKFIVRDYGNCSPRFMRSTMYNVPSTPELMKQAGVPFGLVISPLANLSEGEDPPPVTDFGAIGPVRCIRCKAYMCSFMQFIDGGRRFQCVFCKATTEVPAEYFQHLDHNGMRIDHWNRPELCLGTYEAVATKDYCRDSQEPKTPAVIFAIDVSYPMIKEGVVQLICSNMKSMLENLPRDMNCDKDQMRVGFMTYDSKINFYNINGSLTQPQQMTVGDVNDMFVPLVEGFMVSVAESEAVIDALLEQIPHMFAETRETETILGPVVQAGKEAFKAANCAGKLIVFHHNLPVAEAPGRLKNRDDRKVLGTEKEKTVLMPQSKFYNELGQECVGVGCSVDLFLFNNAYIDVATLSQVCRLTGGQVYKYTYFQVDLDGERFLRDLQHNLSRPIVFDAIMRVRTSTGVRPVEFHGSFYMANTTDVELAAVNADAAIACEIKHDDKLTEEDGVYIQVALLFTSCAGQRRLRIFNLSLNTGTSLAEMYRNCELDTFVNFTGKQSIHKLMESNPKTVKETLINNCANILACYRKNCASPSSAGQLILPECMKLLPLYTNCLIKSDALAGGADVGCDDRAFLMNAISSMDVKSSVGFFYPRLIPIHDLSPEERGVPVPIRCTIEKIRDDGVYILENGIYMFMYIGLACDPKWIQEVFGVQTAAQIDIDKTRLVELENETSRRVREVVELLRQDRPRYMRLVFVRQRDKLDILFRHYLCEDRSGNDASFSYVDFLCHMHKEIRALLG